MNVRFERLRLHDGSAHLDFIQQPVCEVVAPVFGQMLSRLEQLARKQEASSRTRGKNFQEQLGKARNKFQSRYGAHLRRFYRVHKVHIKDRSFSIPFFNKHFFGDTEEQGRLFKAFVRLICRYEKHSHGSMPLYRSRAARKRDPELSSANKRALIFQRAAKIRVSVLGRAFQKLRKEYTVPLDALRAARASVLLARVGFTAQEWAILTKEIPGRRRFAPVYLARLLTAEYSNNTGPLRSAQHQRSGLT